MDDRRRNLIRKARELNIVDLSVIETQERIRQVCAEYLVEAEVDVERLLKHEDWRVRSGVLDMVWWGEGATDGIECAIYILENDPEEDLRAEAALALFEASRGTPKKHSVMAAFQRVLETDKSDYVRNSVRKYLEKWSENRPGSE